MRVNYWSCSNFAKWVTRKFGGVEKPPYATGEGWSEWKREARTKRFVFWFTETFLDSLQTFICWPTDQWKSFLYYIRKRFFLQMHVLKTKLTPGTWYDLDTRILHGLYEEFVDFIEIEKAHMHVICDPKACAKYKPPFWYLHSSLRFKTWRSAGAGLDYLTWEMSLVNEYEWMSDEEQKAQSDFGLPTYQAVNAKEQLDLYNWWKVVRPARIDPMDASGWSAYCSKKRGDSDDILSILSSTDEERIQSRPILVKMAKIEQQQDDEDTEMLIRLIKIRKHLWT